MTRTILKRAVAAASAVTALMLTTAGACNNEDADEPQEQQQEQEEPDEPEEPDDE